MKKITAAVARARKAAAAAVTAGVGTFVVALTAQSPGGTQVTREEWLTVGGIALLAGLATYHVPNDPTAAPPADPGDGIPES